MYTLCIGEKGVFRFKLTTQGRAGHASMPGIGDNALLRMVEVLSRLDGRQPPFDPYPAGVACLEALTGVAVEDVSAALAHVREVEPRLADQFESMMRVTLAPTMIRASEKENVIPSRCTVRVDCRVPPGMGEEHVRRPGRGAARPRGRRRLLARVQRRGRREQLAARVGPGRVTCASSSAARTPARSCCRWY